MFRGRVVGDHEPTTIIGPETHLEGSITSGGLLRVDGHVHGSITHKGELIIGETAVVEADVIADTAVVAGSVTGSVVISGDLELRATAHLTGDVKARRLAIASGALFCGRSEMQPAAEGAAE